MLRYGLVCSVAPRKNFGALTTAPKFKRNGSAETSSATDGFFSVGAQRVPQLMVCESFQRTQKYSLKLTDHSFGHSKGSFGSRKGPFEAQGWGQGPMSPVDPPLSCAIARSRVASGDGDLYPAESLGSPLSLSLAPSLETVRTATYSTGVFHVRRISQ